MAQLVSLLELRTNAYLFADDRASGPDQFMGPTEVDRLINLELADLYDLLIAAREDDGYTVFVDQTSTTPFGPTAANIREYELPDDFYQMRGLELTWGGDQVEDVAQIRFDERNLYTDSLSWTTWAPFSPKGYRMLANTGDRSRRLNLLPTPTGVTNMRLWYIPTCPVMDQDDDTFDGVNGWGKRVSLGVARIMRAAAQNESAQLDQLYKEAHDNIVNMAREREGMEPKRIRDVQPEGRAGLWNIRRRPTAF